MSRMRRLFSVGFLLATATTSELCDARLSGLWRGKSGSGCQRYDYQQQQQEEQQQRQLQAKARNGTRRPRPRVVSGATCDTVQHEDSVRLAFQGSLPSQQDENELKGLFAHAYNTLVQAGRGCDRRTLVSVDFPVDSFQQDWDEWSVEAVVTWTCVGCRDNVRLFRDEEDHHYGHNHRTLQDEQDCDSPCPAVSILSFEDALALLVEDSGNLMFALEEVVEIEQVTCPTTQRDTFTATLVLDVATVQQQLTTDQLLQPLQTAVTNSLQQRIFGGDQRRTSYCDPYFRQITSVSLLPRNAPSTVNQRHRLLSDESVDPPNFNPIDNTGVSTEDGATPTMSPVPTTSPVPSMSPAPTFTASPTTSPTNQFQFAYMSFLLSISGTCRGCQYDFFLLNDVSDTTRQRRAAAHSSRAEPRFLMAGEQEEECVCPAGALLRSPTEEEARGQFGLEFQADETLSTWVQNVVGTFEVSQETCTGTILEDFTYFDQVTVYLRNGHEPIRRRDRDNLEWAFLEAYNEAMDDYCDPLFRWISDVELQGRELVSNDDRGESIRLYRLEFLVWVEYQSPDSAALQDVELFDEGDDPQERNLGGQETKDRQDPPKSRRRGRNLWKRRLSEDSECYCPVDPIAYSAPSYNAFLSIFQDLVQEGIEDGSFQDVFLSPDGYTPPVPTNPPTTYEEGESDNNDYCGGAQEIRLRPENDFEVYLEGSTEGATVDRRVGFCGYNLLPTAPGVWYEVRGQGVDITASTCHEGTDYDTQMTVYAGRCGDLECVESNDDSCDLKSSVTWYGEDGETYFLLVHGSGSSSGAFGLDVRMDIEGRFEEGGPPPPGPNGGGEDPEDEDDESGDGDDEEEDSDGEGPGESFEEADGEDEEGDSEAEEWPEESFEDGDEEEEDSDGDGPGESFEDGGDEEEEEDSEAEEWPEESFEEANGGGEEEEEDSEAEEPEDSYGEEEEEEEEENYEEEESWWEDEEDEYEEEGGEDEEEEESGFGEDDRERRQRRRNRPS